MSCRRFRDMIEAYIMGEISPSERELFERHMENCDSCMRELQESGYVIERIRNMEDWVNIGKEVLAMSKKEIGKRAVKRKWVPGKLFPAMAACFCMTVAVLACSILAFPSFAASIAPRFPLVKSMVEAREENDQLKQQVEEIEKENEVLKLEIKKIKDVEIVQVNTSDTVSEEERYTIQALVIDFVRAQYRGDVEWIRNACTQEFAKHAEELVKDKKGEVVFTQITNVAKEGDLYLVFVRLNDTSSEDDADYQENFELVKENGKFLVSFVGLDA